jgi:hypothetical protein
MTDIATIKQLIEKETQRVFSKNKAFELKDTIDLFYKALVFPLNKPELRLDGLEHRVPNALDKILNEGLRKIDNIAYFIEFAKIEQYLRKILFLINPAKFNELETNKSGLGAFINVLQLNPNRIDFEKDRVENLYNSQNYGEHLFRTYNLRNIESHQCESWTNRELYENIESVLVIYLFATNKYKNQLKPLVEVTTKEPDFKNYLETVKSNFKSRIGKFIHLQGQENIKLTQGYVIENIIDEENEGNERKGTVDDLRKSNIPENRMIIWGDAGMGKSTTLEYLAYVDAEEKMKNSRNKLPVYLPLGLLTDKSISIKQTIFNKINVDNSLGEKLLKEGKINLFLDALNEIPRDDNNSLKSLRLKEINALLSDYKNCFIILSNRPEEVNIFKGIPIFFLQKMDRAQIEIFLKRNTDENPKISNLILDEIKKDERLEKIIRTPLMLSRLIEIVKVKGDIPKSEGEIIDRFIFSLYEREKDEKKDANFNQKIIHRLLRYLGYESLEKKDTNSGMSEDEVLNYFVECKRKYGFEIDTIYVIEIATQLGILEKRDELYSFAHQAYQDYYHAQEEKAILGL